MSGRGSEDPPPGGGGGGGGGGGAGGKAAKDRERVRPDPPTPPDSDADSSEDDVGGGGHRGPPRLGGGVGRDDAVGELFGGHKLACDYDSDNPFERKRSLAQRWCMAGSISYLCVFMLASPGTNTLPRITTPS